MRCARFLIKEETGVDTPSKQGSDRSPCFSQFGNIYELLRGDYEEFYEAKNVLMRYDDRDDYIKYGYS